MCSDAQVEEEKRQRCLWGFNGVLSRMAMVPMPEAFFFVLTGMSAEKLIPYIINLLGREFVPLLRMGVCLSK